MAFEENYIENDRLFKLAESTARLYKQSGTVSGKQPASIINEAVKLINRSYASAEAQFGNSPKVPGEYEWLLDNRYLAVREARIASNAFLREKSLRSSDDGVIILKAAEALVNAGLGKIDSERITLFLEGFQSVSPLPRAELYLFPAALRAALVIRLSKCSDTEEFAAIFSSLRFLASESLQKLLESVDLTERLLMADPAGVYANMSEETRAFYREALSDDAKKRGTDEHRYAAQMLENAKKENRHIGFELFPEKQK